MPNEERQTILQLTPAYPGWYPVYKNEDGKFEAWACVVAQALIEITDPVAIGRYVYGIDPCTNEGGDALVEDSFNHVGYVYVPDGDVRTASVKAYGVNRVAD